MRRPNYKDWMAASFRSLEGMDDLPNLVELLRGEVADHITATEADLKRLDYDIRAAFVENLWRRLEGGEQHHGDIAQIRRVFKLSVDLKRAINNLSGQAKKELTIAMNVDVIPGDAGFPPPRPTQAPLEAITSFLAHEVRVIDHIENSVLRVRQGTNTRAMSVIERCREAWTILKGQPPTIAESSTGPFAEFLKKFFVALDPSQEHLKEPKEAIEAYNHWQKKNNELAAPLRSGAIEE